MPKDYGFISKIRRDVFVHYSAIQQDGYVVSMLERKWSSTSSRDRKVYKRQTSKAL